MGIVSDHFSPHISQTDFANQSRECRAKWRSHGYQCETTRKREAITMKSKLSATSLKMWSLASLMLLAMILLPEFTQAQSTGTVTGTVTDQTGAVVSQAKVTLVNEDTKGSRETTT